MGLVRYILVVAAAVVVAICAASAAGDLVVRPSIESESVSHVTSTDAVLEAKINDQDLAATYEFHLVTAPPCASGECLQRGFTLPSAKLAASYVGQTVSLDLNSAGVSLKPGERYEYWVTATNIAGTTQGSGQLFTTLEPPSITNRTVSGVISTDATIQATIDTGGHETTYRVWIGVYPECIEESALACKETTLEGTIAGASSPTTISVDIAKAWHALSPSSEYIYGVSATNSNWSYEGSTYGPSQVFKTAAVRSPVIESESASHVTSTDAVLEATINGQGLGATYEFHLVSAPPCLTATPPCERPQYLFSTPAGTLLASPVGQSVSADLNSAGITLSPGERYEYWVSATSSAGTTNGGDQVLIAPKEPVTPPATVTSSTGTPPGGPLATPDSQQTGPGEDTNDMALAPSSGVKGSIGKYPARTSKVCKHRSHKHRASCMSRLRKHDKTTLHTKKP